MTQAPTQQARACSVDAGVWTAAMDASSVSAQVPRNGALIVHLSCAVGPACTGDPLPVGGTVRSPSGNELAGHWSAHAGDVLSFVPNNPFALGTGYKVQLNGWNPEQRSFDVVAAMEAPNADAFEATLELASLYMGASGTNTCCTNDSCGSGCYFKRQDELTQLTAKFARHPEAAVLDQLELRAVSSADTKLVSSCVGCSELPALLDHEARASYCVELSVRVLGTGAELALGRKCSTGGRAALAQRDTPEGDIPSVCRSSSDAGVAQDAGQDAASDASGEPPDRVDADAEAPADASLPTEAASADEAADEAEPTSASDGCSTSRRGVGFTWPLVLLALFASRPRSSRAARRARAPGAPPPSRRS